MEREDGRTSIDDLLAAATIGELRRLVNEVEERIVAAEHIAGIGSLQVMGARADDLATHCRRLLHEELMAATDGNGSSPT